MKKFFKHFSFMVIMALVSSTLVSCTASESDIENAYPFPYSYKEKLYGRWSLEEVTLEGNRSVADEVPIPAWIYLDQNDMASYDYNGEAIMGMYVSNVISTGHWTVGLFPFATNPDNVEQSAKSYVFTAYKPSAREMVLVLEKEGEYKATLRYHRNIVFYTPDDSTH